MEGIHGISNGSCFMFDFVLLTESIKKRRDFFGLKKI